MTFFRFARLVSLRQASRKAKITKRNNLYVREEVEIEKTQNLE